MSVADGGKLSPFAIGTSVIIEGHADVQLEHAQLVRGRVNTAKQQSATGNGNADNKDAIKWLLEQRIGDTFTLKVYSEKDELRCKTKKALRSLVTPSLLQQILW